MLPSIFSLVLSYELRRSLSIHNWHIKVSEDNIKVILSLRAIGFKRLKTIVGNRNLINPAFLYQLAVYLLIIGYILANQHSFSCDELI